MNLITDPWIPARTRAGTRTIRPAEIVDPEVIGLAFPRADFNGAVTEWLIGLLATTAAPADDRAWSAWHADRPSVAELDAAFAALAPGFDLSIAMQETDLDGDPSSIEGLLLDTEGAITRDQRVDLMRRVGLFPTMSPAMAAAALITLHSNAPEGGSAPNETGRRQGYYASIRGGGPLSTLVIVGDDLWSRIGPNVETDDLWSRIWPNVETVEQISERGKITNPLDALPWMVDGDGLITPDNSHPCTLYFATVRRIRLIIKSAQPGEKCSLSGEASEFIVTDMVKSSGGRRFAGWRHPFTPYRVDAKGDMFPRRGSTERIGMRDYVGLIATEPKRTVLPAANVSHFRLHRRHYAPNINIRLIAYGFATTQSTVDGWQHGEMPIPLGDRDAIAIVDGLARNLISGTDNAAYLLRTALARRYERQPNVAKKRSPDTARASGQLWRDLEPAFFDALTVAARSDLDADDPTMEARIGWAERVHKLALTIFRKAWPLMDNPEGASAAARGLGFALAGYGPQGEKLFKALEIPTPEKEAAQ